MDAIDIKYRLAKKGLSLKSVANQIGVKLPAVSQVINGHCASLRVSIGIADALEMPLEEVFPKYRKDKEAA